MEKSSNYSVEYDLKTIRPVIRYWQGSGLTEHKDFSRERKHGAIAHMFAGARVLEAVGRLLIESTDLINKNDVELAKIAFLLHDADKPTDMNFINEASEENVSWEKVEELINHAVIQNKITPQIAAGFKNEYSHVFTQKIDLGFRILAAKTIAEVIHTESLKKAGFEDEVISIQAAAEYSGCYEVDTLISNFTNLKKPEQRTALLKIVLNFVDNCMKDSKLVNPIDRAIEVFKKPYNKSLSDSWPKWSSTTETALDLQIRVSSNEIDFISNLMRLNPENLLDAIKSKQYLNFMS